MHSLLRLAPAACALLALWAVGCTPGDPPEGRPPGELTGSSAEALAALRLPDLSGTPVEPFGPADALATVFLFTSTECPVSNRYAPEVERLVERFTPEGVAFRLVYPEHLDSPGEIRRHLEEYGYSALALRDTRHLLVQAAGATMTPEVAVYTADRRLVYRGRIDDRTVAYGQTRQEPRTRDLHDVLLALAEGEALELTTTEAIGCFLPPPPP